ncbi:LysR family transcriptional regulator [Pseudomonas sp. ATCC 13867]|uniref:LysR family transcriptional regulator n=1 Tax=Pseudomonas sp. ATCC 13867 TaxID=1294143 RepID=UPI0002C4E6B2|nr:LysR family transcriptional regulator [Pseudomonas sp. ATCC 13867]AGI24830.1 LysR family transcriptional regulator [Pseudomonas sp. ATCC 13867]RFQ18280.1 LysR family transcriptional regulator [Pseudomonas sp. ATCC 13867]
MSKASFSEAEAFLAVAECGGFGAAGRELGVTQSTISRRVAALEARIGRTLVERTTRRVTLTEAGHTYANELREVLLRLQHAEARAQNQAAEPEGVLHITMPTAFGRLCVLPCVATLAQRYPRLRFELDLSDRYVDLLEGSFDAAVRLDSGQQTGIETEPVWSFGLRLCASPDYISEHGLPLSPADLPSHSYLALRTYAPRLKWSAFWHGRKVELDLLPRITASDSTALRTLVLSGTGIAVLPTYLVSSDLDAGRIIDVLPGLGLPRRDMVVAYPRHRADLSKLRVFTDAMRRMSMTNE